jgi:lysophospholipase L1-like esterase
MKKIIRWIIKLFYKPKPKPPKPWMPDPSLDKDNREVDSNSVVFIGDSLTHIGVWQDFYPGVNTANQGIGGNTTFMVLTRLENILREKPAKIFLLIGANDLLLGIPHPAITEFHRQIIEKIIKESPNTRLYVQSIFPFGKKARYFWPDTVPKSWKKDIKALNTALMNICGMYGVRYIHSASAVSDKNGYLRNDFTADHIHLEKPGYEAWVAYLDKYVREK